MMQVKTVLADIVHARNYQAWALGTPQRNGFDVRRVVWGLTMARAERRPGEQIRRAIILVEREHKRR